MTNLPTIALAATRCGAPYYLDRPLFDAAALQAQQLSSAVQGADYPTVPIQLAVLLGGALFVFGALIGLSLTLQAVERRSRQQDARQRGLNEWEDELKAREQSLALLQATRQPPEA